MFRRTGGGAKIQKKQTTEKQNSDFTARGGHTSHRPSEKVAQGAHQGMLGMKSAGHSKQQNKPGQAQHRQRNALYRKKAETVARE